MTAHSPRILTDAETQLVRAFETVCEELPGNEQLKQNRKVAIETLKSNGLPTRRTEAFHYTDLRALMAAGYQSSPRPDFEAASSAMLDYERLISSLRVPMVNGHYFADMGDDLPDGLSIEPGIRAHDLTADLADSVELINTAFVTDGVNIIVAADARLEGVLTIANSYVGEDKGMAVSRNSVLLKPGAFARIVDRHCGNDGKQYLSSAIVDIDIQQGAELNYVLEIEEGDLAQRLSRLNVRLHKDSKLNLFVLSTGCKLVRQELRFDVLEEGAELNISGINLIGGTSHLDITSVITHQAPGTNATETFRNVATGRGRGVFQGQIKVAQEAQLTDARMACNTLLLSEECDFSAKPELEIFADDVQCAHGATVAELEESYLFYLMARGISEKVARQMLITGFVAELIEEVNHEGLEEALSERLDVWMERNV